MFSQNQVYEAKILIVNDQKLHYLYLEKVFKKAGYSNIKCLADSMQVLKTIQEFVPDLIILDLIMPQLDGFQVLEQINDFRRTNYVPVLALSEEKTSDVRLKALQSGASDFLEQPYENLEILFRIQHLVEMKILHTVVENQNKELENKVTARTKELQDTQLDIIQRLAQAAEFRDSETGSHIIRLGKYCACMGKLAGLTEAECDLLRNAAPLHDVGKIGIPDSILLKPGSLTKQEFEIMKSHTDIGAQLLSGSFSPIMKMAQQIALTHHEKFDGTGYPRQLRGDDIPLIGQICSICDVFDALTTDRPYKQAWSIEKAVEEIKKMKGSHFSPTIVDKFLETLPEIIDCIDKDF